MSISTANPQVATLTRYRFVAVGSETSVSGVDANGSVLAYVAGKEQVYMNGVLLVRGQDYTATNGTSITGLTALAANDVVEVLTFSEFVIANAVDQNLVNAKGDLLAGTAADAVSRLAVGTDGQELIASSSASTGLAWADRISAAGKNAVINGGMDIWQRGTSISVAASAGITYTADRWCLNTGANQAMTISRQATSDTTNLPNIQYCARFQRNSGQTGTGGLFFSSSIESFNAIRYAGQTVTLSFYARSGSNYSATSSILQAFVYSGTGTDQNQLSGFTGSATPISQSATLTTTWQRFTYSGTISASATELAVAFYFTPTGTASTNDYYEITGVQLDVGSVATPFSRAGGTIQGELAACQRYYWRIANTDAYAVYGMGIGESTTALGAAVQLPVPMRVKPTAVDYSSVQFSDTNNSPVPTSLSISSFKSSSFIAYLAGGGLTGLTQYRPYELRNNNSTSGYIGLSAEL